MHILLMGDMDDTLPSAAFFNKNEISRTMHIELDAFQLIENEEQQNYMFVSQK